jgi:hypothetical protein
VLAVALAIVLAILGAALGFYSVRAGFVRAPKPLTSPTRWLSLTKFSLIGAAIAAAAAIMSGLIFFAVEKFAPATDDPSFASKETLGLAQNRIVINRVCQRPSQLLRAARNVSSGE